MRKISKKSSGGPRTKTPEQALASLMAYCSRAERSSGDAIRLMKNWGIAETDAGPILARLIKDRFIDDRRFAGAYTRDKITFAGWGIHKIRSGLLAKGISKDIISDVLAETDSSVSAERLRGLLEHKAASLKGGSVYEKRAKLVRFAASRGFEYEQIADVCDEILKEDNFTEYEE